MCCAIRSAAAGVEATLERLVSLGRVVEGGFRPGGVHREWCDVEVLRAIAAKVAGAA
jgi:ATP-dependent Lhr-like helicase